MTTITQSKFSKISNLIFLTFTTFIISFVWINNYISNIRLSLISSIIISMFFFVSYIVFKRYQNKVYIKNKNSKENIESLKNYLLFSNNAEIIETMNTIFNFSSKLLFINNNHYLDNDNNCDIFLMYDKATIDTEDFIYAYKNHTTNSIKIFCISYNTPYPELENTNIDIIDINKTNKKILENSLNIPTTIKIKKTPKLKIKDILCITLNKSKSRSYLLFGLLILFTSIFTPYYIYYTIIGTLLLLLSLYSRFNSRFN